MPEDGDEQEKRGLHRPGIDDFVFAGEETPLLLNPRILMLIGVAFAALVGAYFVAVQMGLEFDIDAEPFRDWVEDRGIWGPIVYMLALAGSVLFAPIPNVPIYIAAGLAWGWWLGTIYSMGGLMLGSAMAFWVGRRFGRRYFARLIGGKMAERIDDMTEQMGGRLVFWSRMIPVVNFDFISYIAGLTAIAFWPFFFWSFLGMLLPTAVAVIAGDGLDNNIWIPIALGGVWVGGLVGSGLFFWWRRNHIRGAFAESAVGEAPESLQ